MSVVYYRQEMLFLETLVSTEAICSRPPQGNCGCSFYPMASPGALLGLEDRLSLLNPLQVVLWP